MAVVLLLVFLLFLFLWLYCWFSHCCYCCVIVGAGVWADSPLCLDPEADPAL